MSSLKSIIRQRKAENSLGEMRGIITFLIEEEVKRIASVAMENLKKELERAVDAVREQLIKNNLIS